MPPLRDRPSLVIIPQHFGCLLFDHEATKYLPFDHEATQLLDRLRTGGMDAVMADSSTEQQAPLQFCEWLEEAGLLDINGYLPSRRLDVVPPANHLAGPLMVHLEVVGACDLSCKHCFAGDLPRNQQPLSLTEIETLFEDLASIGVFRVSLTGGEPLLRSDLLDVIDAARTRGIHVGLTTNGMQITKPWAEAFGQRPDVRVNVSLEGANAASNDAIRGAGCFAFALAFTIRKQNVNEVADCAALAARCGAATAVFRPLYPVGHARLRPDLMPTFAEYQRALDALAATNKTKTDWVGEQVDSGVRPRGELGSERTIGVNQCGAGKLTASISVQGVVNPCSFLGADFDLDSIRQRKFSEIWCASEGLAKLRECSGSACSEKEELRDDQFTGGCRARSLVLIGDADAADPWHQQHMAGDGRHPLATVEIQSGTRNNS